jgi:hypothetical protein
VKPEEPADIYILSYAETNPAVIVSNDHFSDWCDQRHPWRVENVPRLLLPFEFFDEDGVSFGEKEQELIH